MNALAMCDAFAWIPSAFIASRIYQDLTSEAAYRHYLSLLGDKENVVQNSWSVAPSPSDLHHIIIFKARHFLLSNQR